MSKYIIKSIEDTSGYEGVAFTQKVELISSNGKSVWFEDNLMLISKKDRGLPEKLIPRLNANAFYNNENEISKEEKKRVLKCRVVNTNEMLVQYEGFECLVSDGFEGFNEGDLIWLSVYLKDIVKI